MSFDIKSCNTDYFYSHDLKVVKDKKGEKHLQSIGYWHSKIINLFSKDRDKLKVLDQVIIQTSQFLNQKSSLLTTPDLINLRNNLNSLYYNYLRESGKSGEKHKILDKLSLISTKITDCDQMIKSKSKEDAERILTDCANFLKQPRSAKKFWDKEKRISLYAQYHNQLTPLHKDWINKHDKISSRARELMTQLNQDFQNENPGKRLCITDEGHFVIDEGLLMRQSLIEQNIPTSQWSKNTPDFIRDVPSSLKEFLVNPATFTVKPDQFYDLASFSERYQMPFLKEKCDQFLLHQLTNHDVPHKVLPELFELSKAYSLSRSLAKILSMPLSNFPKKLHEEIKKLKSKPPKAQIVSTSDMVDRLVSTKVGNTYEVKVGSETFHLHEDLYLLKELIQLEQTADGKPLKLSDMTPSAFKAILQFIYYGTINSLSIQDASVLWNIVDQSGAENVDLFVSLKKYITGILDQIPVDQISDKVSRLDLTKDRKIAEELLKTLENESGISFTIENNGLMVDFQGIVTDEVIERVKGLHSLINTIRFNSVRCSQGTFESFLSSCTNLDCLVVEKKGKRVNQVVDQNTIDFIKNAKTIKKLKMLCESKVAFIWNETRLDLPNLEELHISGPIPSKLLSLNTWAKLKHLHCFDNKLGIRKYLKNCHSLEFLSVNGSIDNLMTVFAQPLIHLKGLIVLGDEEKKVEGNELIQFVNSHPHLEMLDIPKGRVKWRILKDEKKLEETLLKRSQTSGKEIAS